MLVNYFITPGLSAGKTKCLFEHIQQAGDVALKSLETECCYYIEFSGNAPISPADDEKITWLLQAEFDLKITKSSRLCAKGKNERLVEIGPMLNFSTPFSTNAVSICHAVGLTRVTRFEKSIRYVVASVKELSKHQEEKVIESLYDRMTETVYDKPLKSFAVDVVPEPWEEVDIIGKGRKALEDVAKTLGLGFDEQDYEYYVKLFRDTIKRNPTTVECFDLAQSNSEHSRHWFFKGKMIVDGQEKKQTLMHLVMGTQEQSSDNNVIKFNDNSSAIRGFDVNVLKPTGHTAPGKFVESVSTRHVLFTAETHNFPTGVAPFPGAATGTGGRIRDTHAAGRGSYLIGGTAGYMFGNLNIPDYDLPWEDKSFQYPSNFAPPLQIAVEASNGASDYGNKFGEPIIQGFARSFGMKCSNGERYEYIKPIMFTGGLGSIDDNQLMKADPEKGDLLIKLGGPIYRIGVGGGAASSVAVQGEQSAELDFKAVQRGDPEMENKLNRVVRACIESGLKNPILSIHDQGAGGNGNVLKEICSPAGGLIKKSRFSLGDPTISTLELWGAEYQESDAVIVKPAQLNLINAICSREKCPIDVCGEVTGSEKIVLVEDDKPNAKSRHPVDLELKYVLGKMPQKVFHLEKIANPVDPICNVSQIHVMEALNRVLRLPAVASKRYLTTKVDRSVTGLIAQQQCVGPLHTPLADVAVVALSYMETVGGATAIGEQPVKGLLRPDVGARMSVAEAVTNLVFAKISSLQDVKVSGNWMWPAKCVGEGAKLYEACEAMCDAMRKLGIAVDGGKDSLSMAARVDKEVVKSPGTLVISAYAPCTDIRLTVTPDLKCPAGNGHLLYVDISGGKCRLGGSSLLQCYKCLGKEPADLDQPISLRKAFNVTQQLIADKKLLAGHDISDGGLVTCLLEMAFAGNCGITVKIPSQKSAIETLFAEEVGWVFEVKESDSIAVIEKYHTEGISCCLIGKSSRLPAGIEMISISVNDSEVIRDTMPNLRDVWEETNFQLDFRQANPDCVKQEMTGMAKRKLPPYHLSSNFMVNTFSRKIMPRTLTNPPSVCVLREEGSNGDREMIAALHVGGFEVWDIPMTDLVTKKVTLDRFRGLIVPGGFSYADVLGSARGWAANLLFDKDLKAQLEAFRKRETTFCLGVCNGCQLFALLGWITLPGKNQPSLVLGHNSSERFESRFSTVTIESSPSIMLKGMEGLTMGVWVAHAEGRFVFQDKNAYSDYAKNNQTPLRYVDDNAKATEVYPFNPNGSPGGLAALCSDDGRHLIMMPHPERCIFNWQWPYLPTEWQEVLGNTLVSPWYQMFENAYKWCLANNN